MESERKTANRGGIGLTIGGKMLLLFGGSISVLLGVIIFAGLFGIPALGIQGGYGLHRDEVFAKMGDIADLKKAEMLHWFEERREDARSFSESGVIRRRLEAVQSAFMAGRGRAVGGAALARELRGMQAYREVLDHADALVRNHNDLMDMSVVDLGTGLVIFSSAPVKVGLDLSDDAGVKAVRLPGIGEQIRFVKKAQGGVFLRILNPVPRAGGGEREENGGPDMAALCDINLENFLGPMLHTGAGLGSTGEIVLVDMNRFILAPLKYPLAGGERAAPIEFRLDTKPAELAAWGIDGQVLARDYRGVPVIAVVRHMRITSEFGIGMIVKMDEREVLAFVRRSLMIHLLTAGLGLVLILGMISLVSRKLAGPIVELSRMAKKVMQGDLNARSRIATGDEVEELARSVNSMVSALQGWQEELEIKVRERTSDLSESEGRFSALLGRSFDGILIHDNFTILDLNERMAHITGYSREELLRSNALSYFTPESQDRMRENNSQKGTGVYEVELRKKDGHRVYIEAIGAPCQYQGRDVEIVAFKDTTNQKKLEEQLRQSQKMESIGQLAGGVAHDFNNILTAIIGYGHIALMKPGNDDHVRRNVEQMLEAANRAAHLTQDLLLFSRKRPSDRKIVDLNKIVRMMEKFIVRVIGEDIACHTRCQDEPLPVEADAHQIEQVLMNLATNARDAMPKGGVFTVATERIHLNEDFTSAHGYGIPGPYALLTVADTGSGMDEETRQRIFDPFFTTKEVGKGTGLGLAVVYGIIKQHEGHINVYSEPGKGSAFRIYLPLSTTGKIEENQAAEAERPMGGTETILLAEDDESLRRMTGSVLEAFGYTVIPAVDGEDAVRLFRERQAEIDLLLFDLVMPRMTGKDACDAIRKLRQDVKIIFTSGYAPDTIRDRVLLDRDVPIAYKPISPVELLKIVRAVLDSVKG